MAVLVDSCVILDIVTNDPKWYSWSSTILARKADVGSLVINPIVYGEVSVGFSRIEDVDDIFDDSTFEYRSISREAAFLAGKCFQKYKARGGVRTTVLPDFMIGAQAAVEGLEIITRDIKRFRTYFPSVQVICP